MHAAELAERLSREHDRIYVFAGDGGYNEVVNGLTRDVEVGCHPGGGTSVLPRALLPRVIRSRPLGSSRGSLTRRISLGRVNGRRFTFSAGLGLDAELVRRVDALGQDSGRRASDLAFARTLFGILAERRGRLDPTMEVVGVGRVASALVANGDPYSFVGRVRSARRPQPASSRDSTSSLRVQLRARLLPQVAWWVTAGRGQQRSRHVLYVHDATSCGSSAMRPRRSRPTARISATSRRRPSRRSGTRCRCSSRDNPAHGPGSARGAGLRR